MANFIINLFKGFNPAYYQNNIDRIYKDYSKLADNVLSGKVTIKKSDIQGKVILHSSIFLALIHLHIGNKQLKYAKEAIYSLSLSLLIHFALILFSEVIRQSKASCWKSDNGILWYIIDSKRFITCSSIT